MKSHETAQVTISANAQKALLLDVYKRQRIEACGVLLGNFDDSGNWYIEEICPLRNIFDSPTYFEFAPEDLLAADIAYPDRVIGVYHSHPTGLAIASYTDRQNMKRVNVEEQIPWVWLIVSGPFDHAPTFLQLVQRHLQRLPNPSIIAYHHYADQGLRQIDIRFEEPVEVRPDEMK
jgi:proteasome lid subunit RPN8/RPN11